MNIIIVGCGRYGSNLANDLSDLGNNVSVVDSDSDKLSVLGSGFNGLIVKGIEYDEEVLKDAEIEEADALFVVTPDENINITVALIAKEIFHVPTVIARIVNPNRQYIYEVLNIETVNIIQTGVEMLKAKISNK